MARRTAAHDLILPSRARGAPAYRWLYAALRAEILQGRLRQGARLPATRDLAEQYGLSRGTIVAAFDQLKSEGYIEGTVGSGTHVSRILPEELLHVARESRGQQRGRVQPPRRLSDYGRRISELKLPTLFVMEGGYAIEAIGINVVNVLTGFLGR